MSKRKRTKAQIIAAMNRQMIEAVHQVTLEIAERALGPDAELGRKVRKLVPSPGQPPPINELLTPPMTQTCIAEIFTCHRNHVTTKVLHKHFHEKNGRKIRMLVSDMPPGYLDVIKKHSPRKLRTKK